MKPTSQTEASPISATTRFRPGILPAQKRSDKATTIPIDGTTDITFTENVAGPYESYGWEVLDLPDVDDTYGDGDGAFLGALWEASASVDVDWIAAAITHMHNNGLTTIEPTAAAENAWIGS